LGHIAKASRLTTTKAQVLTFYLSAIFFRSAWKYRDRAYRYNLLDTGHLVENLILALKAVELPYALSYDFDDHGVNRLLGLDETKEVCLSVCYISGAKSLRLEEEIEVAELPVHIRNASHVAEKEADYAVIREMHGAGGIVTSPSGPEVEMIHELGLVPAEWTKINFPKTWPETINYPDCVFRRRSKRNYVREPISHDCLLSLLDSLCATGLETPSGPLDYRQSICTGFLIGNTEGFPPGFYLLEASAKTVGMVAPGYFMDRMARICLDQAWLANAAVHFLFLTNLDTLDRLWGARGYRYAMETAGRMGQRLYVTATSMGLGCCGIGAFYDTEATELLNVNNASRLLYLVAVGPVKRE
jgi:nitroreductase